MQVLRKLTFPPIKRLTLYAKKSFSSSSGFVSINDSEQLYFEQKGNLTNKPMICIPGALGSTRSDFSYQIDLLSDTFNVIAFDPRGYGKSKDVRRTFDQNYFHQDAEDAAEVMTLLGHCSYSVMGWSDGGIAGMILAAQKPANITNLIIWGARAYVSAEDKELMENTRDLSNWSEKMRTPLEDLYGKEELRKLWTEFLDGYGAFYDQPNGICIKELQEITCRTLIVHGAKDALVPDSHSNFIQERIKNSKLFVFPEGKHNLHMKFHKEFNQMVREFINRHGTRGVLAQEYLREKVDPGAAYQPRLTNCMH